MNHLDIIDDIIKEYKARSGALGPMPSMFRHYAQYQTRTPPWAEYNNYLPENFTPHLVKALERTKRSAELCRVINTPSDGGTRSHDHEEQDCRDDAP